MIDPHPEHYDELAHLSPAPGIYFDMPEEDYHLVPALSQSTAKQMLLSPFEYWWRSPLNDGRPDEKRSDAREKGKAYHALLLEGEDKLNERFTVRPVPEMHPAHPDILRTTTDLKSWLRDAERPVSGDLATLARRAADAGCELPIWPLIMDEWEADEGNKTALSQEAWNELQRAAMIVRNMPSIRGALDGGASEVSLFWRDPRTGCPCKSRTDKLRHDGVIDLKTMSNQFGKPLWKATVQAIVQHGYHLQPLFNLTGLKALREAYSEGHCVIDGTEDEADLVRRIFTAKTPPRFLFLFVQTGEVPHVIAREWARFSAANQVTDYWKKAEADMRAAIDLHARCVREFGIRQPWIVDHGVTTLGELEFPTHFMDEAHA